MKYELDLYDKWCEGKEEGIKEGLSEGIQKGRKEGRDEGILQTAAARRGARPEENKKKPPQKRRPKKKADTVIRTSRYGCGSGTVMVSVWIVLPETVKITL